MSNWWHDFSLELKTDFDVGLLSIEQCTGKSQRISPITPVRSLVVSKGMDEYGFP